MKIKAILTALLMLAASGAGAATRPNLVVEGVQMPAWVEHASGARDPLVPGAALDNKDRIYTGPGARALLRLADGSLVKLGENGILALDDLGQRKIKLTDVVTASLDVVSGAFRFTTQTLNRFRGERDVKVRIVTITAGIRGTDLWGKADNARDLVCLIEGKIEVVREQQAFTMDQPMSFYVAPRNDAPQPVAPVSKEQLDLWSAETEIAAGAGAARTGGKWRVYVIDANNQDDALKAYDRLRNAGYAADIRPVAGDTGTTYRVRISHLANKQEAAVLAAKLKGRLGIAEPKVSR
jgi:hypothetical protein